MRWSRPFQPLLAAGDGLMDRILCVLGAVVCSQLPEFIQQYLQRLGGHLDEARRQLAQFQEVAAQSGVTLEQLIAKTRASVEPAVAQLATVMRETVERVDALASAESALRNASILTRPFVFLRHIDLSIAHATAAIFRPAVPTTPEGLVYAALGMLLALGLYHGVVKYPVRRLQRRRAVNRITPREEPG